MYLAINIGREYSSWVLAEDEGEPVCCRARIDNESLLHDITSEDLMRIERIKLSPITYIIESGREVEVNIWVGRVWQRIVEARDENPIVLPKNKAMMCLVAKTYRKEALLERMMRESRPKWSFEGFDESVWGAYALALYVAGQK